MSDVKDYTSASDSHFCGVKSQYSKRVDQQNRMQPKYAMPGEDTGEMRGEKSNKQAGP